MAQVEKIEKTVQIQSQGTVPEVKDAPGYAPKMHQVEVAHITIVRDDRLMEMFAGTKEAFAVFFGTEYVGVVERPRGNQMWNGYPRGRRRDIRKVTSKSASGAAWALIEDRLNVVLESEGCRLIMEKRDRQFGIDMQLAIAIVVIRYEAQNRRGTDLRLRWRNACRLKVSYLANSASQAELH